MNSARKIAHGPQAQGQNADTVRSMFDRIAPTYDKLNHLLSGGIDKAWRVELARELPDPCGRVLDLCAGTLDLGVAVSKEHPEAVVLGADFSVEMLKRGRHKLPDASLLGADALHLPFQDESFDAVVCGFGVRNVSNLEACFREIRRVLRPGGVFAILEFFRAENTMTRVFHRIYNQGVLPSVGAMISRDKGAYQYLADSMERFHSLGEAAELMASCGYANVSGRNLIFGIASILRGVREEEDESQIDGPVAGGPTAVETTRNRPVAGGPTAVETTRNRPVAGGPIGVESTRNSPVAHGAGVAEASLAATSSASASSAGGGA